MPLTDYQVGHCVPAKLADGTQCVCVPPEAEKAKACTELVYRDKQFHFKMFPWNRTGVDVNPFTIVVFGDMGLMKEAPKSQKQVQIIL
jgi:hypothetical protein